MSNNNMKNHSNNNAMSVAPSHWMANGHAVILPPPSALQRRAWVERSIVQAGLLQAWKSTGSSGNESSVDVANKQQQQQDVEQQDNETQQQQEQEQDTATSSSATPPQIHPLALASARLQNEGINELNRSINLVTLVQTGEYFGMTNIVADAALELAAAAAATTNNNNNTSKEKEVEKEENQASEETSDETSDDKAATTTKTTAGTAAATKTSSSSSPQDTLEFQKAQYYASLYILKRKQGQFQQAAQVLKRHCARLKRGLKADDKPMKRLAALRHRWRLVAPEHGQRARSHAVRPTEVLAVDVDLAAASNNHNSNNSNSSSNAHAAGRLARRIPRYATIELREKAIAMTETNDDESNNHKKRKKDSDNDDKKDEPTQKQTNPPDDDPMEIDDDDKVKPKATTSNNDKDTTTFAKDDNFDPSASLCWTYAEPFALADPTLGKLDADFDPSKIEMLTLQFSLEDNRHDTAKDSDDDDDAEATTVVSACLEPTRSLQTTAAQPDEAVLMELQHSLLCSKLFESMRRELADDTDEVGQVRTTSQQLYQNVVWLAATAGVATRPQQAAGFPHLRALQVVHVHEGEVSVQLNARYTLRVQLVPSSTALKTAAMNRQDAQQDGSTTSATTTTTKAELLLLCKTLLWKAHSLYHDHFVAQQAKLEKQQEEAAAAAASQKPTGHLVKPVSSNMASPASQSPHILQHCVHLGTKLLMERQVRKCFVQLQTWFQDLQQQCNNTQHETLTLKILTLSTKLLDEGIHWTVSVENDDVLWVADVVLEGGPHLKIRPKGAPDDQDHRKVDFESIGPFALFFQQQLRQILLVQAQQ